MNSKLTKNELIAINMKLTNENVALRNEVADTRATLDALRAEIADLRAGDTRTAKQKCADIAHRVVEGIDHIGRRTRTMTCESSAAAAAKCREFATSAANKTWSFCAKGVQLVATKR